MRAVVNWIFLTALAGWLGSTMFFSFVLAPTLKEAVAADIFYETVLTVYPVYFKMGIASGVTAFVIAAVKTMRTGRPKRLLKWGSALIAAMLILHVIGHYFFVPEMEKHLSAMMSSSGSGSADQLTQYYNFTQGIGLLHILLGLFVLLFIAIDMRWLPGRAARGGISFIK